MDWSEDAAAVFADIDAEGNGSHDRTSAQETVAMIFPATVPDPQALLNDNENAVVTEKISYSPVPSSCSPVASNCSPGRWRTTDPNRK